MYEPISWNSKEFSSITFLKSINAPQCRIKKSQKFVQLKHSRATNIVDIWLVGGKHARVSRFYLCLFIQFKSWREGKETDRLVYAARESCMWNWIEFFLFFFMHDEWGTHNWWIRFSGNSKREHNGWSRCNLFAFPFWEILCLAWINKY